MLETRILYPESGGSATFNTLNSTISGVVFGSDVPANVRVSYLAFEYGSEPSDISSYLSTEHGSNLLLANADTVSGGISFDGTMYSTYGWSLDCSNIIPGNIDGSVAPTVMPAQGSRQIKLYFYTVVIYSGSAYVLSDPSPLLLTFLKDHSNSIFNPSPTGIKASSGASFVEITIPKDSYSGSLGYVAGINVYASAKQGGPYYRLGGKVITETVVEHRNSEIFDNSYKSGDLSVVTKASVVETDFLYRYRVPRSEFNQAISFLYGNSVGFDPITGTTPLLFGARYFVYDSASASHFESNLSEQISARMLPLSETPGLPVRSQKQVLATMMDSLLAKRQDISLMPGTVTRDLLDVISDSFARQYVIDNFIHARGSALLLMQLDDEDGDGESDAVVVGSPKFILADALGVTGEVVQSLIDGAFDDLANSKGLFRMNETPSTGSVTIETQRIPYGGINIPAGSYLQSSSGLLFSTETSLIVSESSAVFSFDANSKTYKFEVPVVSVSGGTDSNVPVNSINSFADQQFSSFRVYNMYPTYGGSKIETNSELGSRILLSGSGVDTGSRDGYKLAVMGVRGVEEAVVLTAGDNMVVRDVIDGFGKSGGAVDIFVRGVLPSVHEESFAIQFGNGGTALTEVFLPHVPESLRLRSTNPDVNSENPIIAVYSVRNETRLADYDIQGISIGGDGETIQLVHNDTNSSIGMGYNDILTVKYLYRGKSLAVFSNQPALPGYVPRISKVGGSPTNATVLQNTASFKFDNDPAYLGGSVKSDNGVFVRMVPALASTNLLVGSVSESIQMLGSKPSPLSTKGVDLSSVIISSIGGSEKYIEGVDYTLYTEGQTSYVMLDNASRIRSGDVVGVTYNHALNYSVIYTTNRVISDAQKVVDKMGHLNSGALVKAAIANIVKISLKVRLKNGIPKENFDSPDNEIRLKIVDAVIRKATKGMGEGLNQDEIISAVRMVDEVEGIVLPLLSMRKSDMSYQYLEKIGYVNWTTLSTDRDSGLSVYMTTNSVLNYPTYESGSKSGYHSGVYEDGIALERAANESSVASGPGKFYIRGDGRVVVTTRKGSDPENSMYMASYWIKYSDNESIVSDITTCPVEYLIATRDSVTVSLD